MAGEVTYRRRIPEQVELSDQLAELAQGAGSGEVVNWTCVPVGYVVKHVVDDVLADSFLPAAAPVDDR